MALRFRPVDSSFYDLFAQSAQHLVHGSGQLAQVHVDGGVREALAQQMRVAEHQADESTHQLIRQVNSTFVTPFDREDIYRLASSLDDVMDYMEAAVDLVVLYNIGELPAEVADQVDVLERASELTAAAMPRLRAMKDLADYWVEINRLENEGDRAYRMLLVRLFSGEYDALTVLKMKEVADELEAACDAFEHVANTVETIAVKES